jgi:hypothetical protein
MYFQTPQYERRVTAYAVTIDSWHDAGKLPGD